MSVLALLNVLVHLVSSFKLTLVGHFYSNYKISVYEWQSIHLLSDFTFCRIANYWLHMISNGSSFLVGVIPLFWYPVLDQFHNVCLKTKWKTKPSSFWENLSSFFHTSSNIVRNSCWPREIISPGTKAIWK